MPALMAVGVVECVLPSMASFQRVVCRKIKSEKREQT